MFWKDLGKLIKELRESVFKTQKHILELDRPWAQLGQILKDLELTFYSF